MFYESPALAAIKVKSPRIFPESEQFNVANARLIAAAPDLYEAVSKVIAATRAYLPPDGISKEEFISLVIEATDNARIVEVMK
ncbi:MAG TPA: hypothetical protein VIM62_05815 [Acidobacteriaceae bacterium]